MLSGQSKLMERKGKRGGEEEKKKENDPDLNSSFQCLRRPMFFIPYSLAYMMLRWVIIEADSR